MRITFFLFIGSIFFLFGCVRQKVVIKKPQTPQNNPILETSHNTAKNHRYRKRKQIPTNQNQYEGSLWEDESSWGNLLRDHRAMFKGDVVTITNIQEIISYQEPQTQPAQEGQNNPIRAVANEISEAEKERMQVQQSIKEMSARVIKVLPNGNMVVVGQKIEYKYQNLIQYITTIKGIIRAEDVSSNNEVPAIKLAEVDLKTNRRIKSNLFKTAKQKIASSIFDRIAKFASGGTPAKKSATQNNEQQEQEEETNTE